MPTPGQVWEQFLKAAPAFGSGLVVVWAWLKRQRKARQRREAERNLDSQCIRYLMDAVFHLYSERVPNSEFVPSQTVMRDQWLLIKQQRARVAKADGLDFAEMPEQVKEYLSRTMRIQARIAKQATTNGEQNMFSPREATDERDP